MSSERRSDRAVADAAYRKTIFRVLLLVTLAGGLLFSLLNIFHGVKALGFVELAMAVFSLVALFAMRGTLDLRAWILAYLGVVIGGMIFIFSHPGAKPAIFIWALVFPLVAHLMAGRRLGLIISSIAITVTGAIFIWRFQDDTTLMNSLRLTNVGVCALAVLVFSQLYEVSRERSEAVLHKLATTDNLTGLANRMRFTDVFAWERRKALREDYALSLVLIDLDHFKSVNDSYGHDAGDKVLQHVATTISARLRATDLLCRIGGEEFGIMVPKGSLAQVEHLVLDLQRVLADTPCLVAGQELRVTFSAGISQLRRDGDNLSELFSVADRRMYQSKADGRNCITSIDRPGFSLKATGQAASETASIPD